MHPVQACLQLLRLARPGSAKAVHARPRNGVLRRLTPQPARSHHAGMTIQKKRKPTGRLVDVARVVSIGQDRKTGEAILRFKDTKGSLVAVRLRPRQFQTLANGVLGLAQAREEQ